MEASSGVRRAGDHIWFGFFICLVGLALLFIAFADLIWMEPVPPRGEAELNGWIAAGLVVAVTGTVLFFAGVHRPLVDGLTASMRREWRRRPAFKRQFMIRCAVAGSLLMPVSAYLLWEGVDSGPVPPSPQMAQFALTLPLPAAAMEPEPGTSASAPAETPARREGREPDQLRQDILATNRHAVLFWHVPAEQPEGNPGLLSMSLAAALTIAFGLVYPAISMAGDEEGKSLVGKLVVPALSLVLFGVGAGERANAEENRQDVNLVSRGLPPVISKGGASYVLDPRDPSRDTSRQLQRSLDELMAQLREHRDTPDAMRLADSDRREIQAYIEDQVLDVREDLRRGYTLYSQTRTDHARLRNQLTDGFDYSRDTMRRLGDAIDASARANHAAFAALEERDQMALCALIRSHLASARNIRSMAVSMIELNDRRDLFRQGWLSVTGQTREAAEARQRFAEEVVPALARDLDVQRHCGSTEVALNPAPQAVGEVGPNAQ